MAARYFLIFCMDEGYDIQYLYMYGYYGPIYFICAVFSALA